MMSELTDYLRSMSEVEGDTLDQAADEIERLRAAILYLRSRLLIHADYCEAVVSDTGRGFCYCKIGAGGKPCVSREHCDEHGGTQQYLDTREALGNDDE